ncbi:hypothetical protein BHE90_001334 [Fusarium euwallaceae]|uniref:Uncharacterized protein n=1 Tax=Fusarium euwallaceae TaxID=1147111 RepID=A0A430M814_9HYPO|nr:hypothetical protein BHE90_001334 [Fusarium euwallaceae]
MVAAKFLLVAMVACTKASPVVTAPDAATTDWTALAIPDDSPDLDGIDMDAFKNPANWKNDSSPDEIIEDASSNPAEDVVKLMAGPCEQGTCPDYNAGFDLVYTFTAVPVNGAPGDPPLTIFSSNSDIRVNDCGKCYRQKVGSSLGNSVPGGCYDFTACGRKQNICVDPGKTRAHRIWKDNGHKTCYNMKVERLGSCGVIKTRIVVRPTGTTACNW